MRSKRTEPQGALRAAAALAAPLLLLTGCGTGGGTAGAGDGEGTLTIWAHQGQDREVVALQNAVDAFGDLNPDITVELTLIPEADYTTTLTTSSPDELPDVIEFDGPTMASLVYNGKLSPIDDLVSEETRANATESILAQGTLDGSLYGLGVFDSGLGVYGNAALLDEAGISYPEGIEDAWTAEEFTAALADLAVEDEDGRVLDVKQNYGFGSGSEWTTYAFSPVVWSAGGSLIEDDSADGALNTPATVEALSLVQEWAAYTDANTDDNAFVSGDVALSLVGHWEYPNYVEALGEDLVVLPLPDFGNGVKTGQGSWAWGVSSTSGNGSAAGAFIDFLMADEQVAALTAANGAPPGTATATEASDLYGPGGDLELFADQLAATCGRGAITADCVSVPRPVTAGYPVITRQFAEAFATIWDGGDVSGALDGAVRAIDTDFADNDSFTIP
ncbi:ABC transporter substrate-binding protein [Nocardiopsis lambiniae]|uniref:Sugar ABC transporter substrate-binding protein n=1 Tax=Nocardiopsis lambiniae TaxID=3075539 RepID=A0ABU2M7B6_9ACTN|nr:sugar ABC transporter substrate-binding protein [Nocardiopsis sp. DSM 44743]MDT0328568.1 sugar ABC transporter substrate-binding protein [Nocardiopsis sp. DSM 44743]